MMCNPEKTLYYVNQYYLKNKNVYMKDLSSIDLQTYKIISERISSKEDGIIKYLNCNLSSYDFYYRFFNFQNHTSEEAYRILRIIDHTIGMLYIINTENKNGQ